MIVWGGSSGSAELNTGGRYNPVADSWAATSTSNAPTARYSHTVIWTGSEMIVWGGSPRSNTGGRYNPVADSWTATSTTNAPTARDYHTAVWTGSEMIVWGGSVGTSTYENTGGRYNPATESWIPIEFAYVEVPDSSSGGFTRLPYSSGVRTPIGRSSHTAVWTGNQMILFAGNEYGDLEIIIPASFNLYAKP
jgi:hypothetical protein